MAQVRSVRDFLFAAAAVGGSASGPPTRAGAGYGLALVGVVILANVTAHPAFRFGPHYAAATGRYRFEGYRRRGRWALVLYGLLTLATMFTIQAGVTVVTAGLAIATFRLPAGPVATSALLIAACGLMLAAGHYRVLDPGDEGAGGGAHRLDLGCDGARSASC